MQIHELKPKNKRKSKKRIGRGGKRGAYSGRGIKGQKSRAGHKKSSSIKEIIAKLPKLRGVGNIRVKLPVTVVNVGDLEKIFREGKISKKSFVEKGIIKRISDPVKILGDGELNAQFVIEDIPLSRSAKDKIEKAGGKVLQK